MGMMYAWATPDYMLWNMTIGQIILLHNKAVEIRTPPEPGKKESALNSAEDVKAKREELRKLYGSIGQE